ncbi:Hypothetical Protein FCC1311_038592 [Hondaea fermentalgiana]|uniref:Uncharacterized protein n=1 Tax=Hondaea fermentalgiana TaxID=2315210 RepID=A0A2R5G9B0_9STRA|nr:Hypothetical Protein FCC1311_038592 [Hondaea fermentalgiana]|eukprot:GBG27636.1 Hypothetical Protein FCC1311_038592 [Hondaea fermentalgiana]
MKDQIGAWRLALAVCLLTTTWSGPTEATIVKSPSGLAGRDLATTLFAFSEDAFAVGDLVVADSRLVELDTNWCNNDCQGPPAGMSLGADNVTLVQLSYSEPCFHCGYEWLALMAESVGASATLYFSDETAGHEFRVIHNRKTWAAAKGIPFLELGADDATALRSYFAAGEDVVVDVMVSANPWRKLFDGPGWISVQVICSLMAIYVLYLASWRLHKFAGWYIREGAYKVAVWILTIEVICNLIRLVYAAIDPLWSRSVFLYGSSRFMLTLTIPIGLLSSVMLFLTWNDMLKASHAPSRSLLFHRRSSRIIFLLVSLIFIGFELAVSFLAIFKGLVALSEAAALAEASFTLFVAMAVIFVGWRLLRTLSDITTSRLGSKVSKAQGSRSPAPSKDTSKGSIFPPGSPRPATLSSPSREAGQVSPAVEGDFSLDTNLDLDPEAEFDLERDCEISPPSSPRAAENPRYLQSTRTRDVRAASGSSKTKGVRPRAASNLRRLTWKIILSAAGLIASAVVIALAGQAVILFKPTERAIFFVLYYASQTARSYFTVSFFDPRRR